MYEEKQSSDAMRAAQEPLEKQDAPDFCMSLARYVAHWASAEPEFAQALYE